MEIVRASAVAALTAIAGEAEVEKLPQKEWPDDRLYKAFSLHWIESLKTWEDLQAAEIFLRSPNPELRRLGARGAKRLSILLQNGTPDDSPLPYILFAQALADFDRAEPSWRSDVLDIFYRFGTTRVERWVTTVALRASVDHRPAIMARGISTMDRMMLIHRELIAAGRDTRSQSVVTALLDARITEDPPVARLAERWTEQIDPKIISRVAPWLVVYAVQRGQSYALKLLSTWNADPVQFAVAASENGLNSVDPRVQLDLMRGLEQLHAQHHVIPDLQRMLSSPFAEVRNKAIELLQSSRGATRIAVLVRAIQERQVIHNSTLEEIRPHRREFTGGVWPILQGTDVAAIEIALNALAVTGYAGHDVEAGLDRLLRNKEPTVRHAAARVLGTDRANVIARIPELIVALRSEQMVVRSNAARELHVLHADEPSVTQALVAAVERGDLLVREGLALALERAYQDKSRAFDVLKDLAQSATDPTTRAYAKAALREIAAAPK
jgi:hypothetical protein